MKKYYCDICGADVTRARRNNSLVATQYKYRKNREEGWVKMDICYSCVSRIKEYVRNNDDEKREDDAEWES